MKALLLALFILFAAGANAREQRLPVPPIPPPAPPWSAAPVPDRDVIDHYDAARSSIVSLDPTINRRDGPDPGLGYAPGARYQFDKDRRWFALPGIVVRVPLP